MQLTNLELIKQNLSIIQKEALDVIEDYLESRFVKYQSIVKMPTGSGKTGIIGIVANLYNVYNNILIVSPNGNLPYQIKEEIETKFWRNIGVEKPEIKPLKVCKVKDFYEPNEGEGIIIVTTVQSIMSVFNENKKLYRKLKRNIDLIIFDEGHREPSTKWGEVIRDLNKKTILFTATPYRNDELKFSLHNSKFRYEASFRRAINEKLIKDFSFKKVKKNYFGEDNIEEFSNFVYELFEECQEEEKILIRCNNSNDIERIADELNKRYRVNNADSKNSIALGLHSNFSNKKEDYLLDNILSLENIQTKFNIFIHEYMLVEGSNLPNIDKLIIHGDFRNTRSLIQQIGRIVRLNNFEQDAEVYVNEEMYLQYKSQWDGFLKYEEENKLKQKEKSIIYYNREFREMFNLKDKFKTEEKFVSDSEFIEELLLPKSTIVYEANDISFIQIKNLLKKNIEKRKDIDRVLEYADEEKKLWVICYEKTKYSNLLKSRLYEETSLECMLAYLVNKNNKSYLFYFDSRGHSLLIDQLYKKLKRIDVEKMLGLFPSKDTDFKKVKLNSLALSSNGVLGRMFEGNNIQDTQTNITERISVCNQVQGFLNVEDNIVNRYVGILNSRIRDDEKVSLLNYTKWTNEIVDIMQGSSKHEYFDRFALPVFEEENYDTSSILLDFSKILEDYKIVTEDDKELDNIESLFAVCNNNKFKIKFNDEEIEGEIISTTTKKQIRYTLNIPSFRKEYYAIDNSSKKDNLVSVLNKEQSFRVMFKDTNVIYHEGYFFKPNVEFNNRDLDSLEIGKKIIVFEELGNCKYEKFGKEPENNIELDHWPEDSVFGSFEKAIKSSPNIFNQNIDYLICDDLGAEIADFIAIDEENSKIILIHCKHKRGAKKSASAFQDLCGQAVKNVAYIMKNSIESLDPNNHYDRWNEKWEKRKLYNENKENEKVVKIKANRIRHSKDNILGEQLWKKYKEILGRPDSSTEVWLVMGGLSRGELKDELSKTTPEEQIPQLMWLLYSTQETIAQYGGTLKIFCKK